MANQIVKQYSNKEVTVIWKPKLCIHAAVCVKTLPEVYKPDEKPWILPENASGEALIAQIKKCPSGALTYKVKDSSIEEGANAKENNTMETKVEVLENGPLMVHGSLQVTDSSGNTETKKRATAFCRCGASQNKPYCDGGHNGINFKG